MILAILILILGTLAGGFLAYGIGDHPRNIRYPLIFAGSFLFSITIIHILPEVFTVADDVLKVSLFVLGGFFFQQLLEYFSSGIEHGHSHAHQHLSSGGRFGLVVALMLHSLLEGTLLSHNSPFHEQHESHALLIGILLHKIPAAYALVTTLRPESGKLRGNVLLILILFSISSPIGLIFSQQMVDLSSQNFLLLFAFVAGSFLHISTTIFVESSPEHHFGVKKFIISLGGALLAIISEYLL